MWCLVAFPSHARILWECLTIHFPPTLFSFFFSFKVAISSCTLIPLFMPGSVHSGSVSWDDCGWIISDKLHDSWFSNRFPHYAWTAAWSAHSDFIESRMYACLGVNCHLYFLQTERDLLCATAVTWGRTPNKTLHTKLTQEKKILLPLLSGFQLATFQSGAWRSYQQALPAPYDAW